VFKGELAMFKTVLVPLDGSLRAEYALPIAAQIARHTGSMLVLVRVVSFATEYWPMVPAPAPPVMRSAVDGELQEAAIYLKHVASSAQLEGIEAITIARHGVTAPVILAVATEYHADLIVMGSHGHTGVAHVLLGSVAEKIARHASVPVLVLREKVGFPAMNPAEVAQPLRILVSLDGSTYAHAALEPAAELLSALAAPAQKMALHLLRVIEPAADQKEEAQVAQHKSLSRARSYLGHITDLIRDGYIAPSISRQQILVNWSVALDHDYANAIVRVTENGEDVEGVGVFGGCDLIAMATHGREGLQRWTMGSVTERVLHATKRPLLIVRSAAVGEEWGTSFDEKESIIG
jgi:nucleotide-binding universal stress UspA family protein